ncbi:phosphate ABC transporter permease PstA [Vibrio mexicanus]|uniref:phosphate ABC transporter permease PstA n=1 Tax=Vibrio mexicanus TaxID=1004326 RepID=UPI00063C07C1|nr:phosphate ABC transporter permease PstA [Vibrio mexicanus]
MFKWLKSGSPWIWLTGGAVSISLLSVLGLLLLIGWKGLSYFWPANLHQWQTTQGNVLVGQIYDSEAIPVNHLREMDYQLPSEVREKGLVTRHSIKIANRDHYDADFISILDIDIESVTTPSGWMVVERTRNGDFFGVPVSYRHADNTVSDEIDDNLELGLQFSTQLKEEIDALIEQDIRSASRQVERLRLQKRRLELNDSLTEEFATSYREQLAYYQQQLLAAESTLDALRAQLSLQALIMRDMQGQEVEIPLNQILRAWYPNDMSLPEKAAHWATQVWRFLSENPRESNSEGGVFPAIFGTVLLVLIMSVIVMPLGVIAAIYLHEYAKNNAFTRIIRVAVINLAGVPSIVYGVFGLGFFVYTLGGSIDSLLYSERLPAPTFGTPGLLWSALTLAVLTLPVVIVATEEGLTRIPSSVRHGSLALGATQSETLWRIVLPMASPAIITGLILAIARAAGEVAPLMLVGAVKMTSNLPVDGQFPFLHLERKFMHLGFHIYDVGFQTTNIEAARPLVYATSFLLVTVIVSLNLTAISIRNNLREKYRTLGQD